MQPADLNMITTVIAHDLFLFVSIGDRGAGGELAQDLFLLKRSSITSLENIRPSLGQVSSFWMLPGS